MSTQITQKAIRQMMDINVNSRDFIGYTEHTEKVFFSAGVYGCNGWIRRGYETGLLYGCVGRTSEMFGFDCCCHKFNRPTTADLNAFCDRNSFYGKCHTEEGENGVIWLVSYKTRVCALLPTGQIRRTWGGYSATTMRHVNAFIDAVHGKRTPKGGKAWWDAQSVYSNSNPFELAC